MLYGFAEFPVQKKAFREQASSASLKSFESSRFLSCFGGGFGEALGAWELGAQSLEPSSLCPNLRP